MSIQHIDPPRICQACNKPFAIISTAAQRFCSPICAGAGRRESLATRFWRKVDKTESCWIWIGERSHNGYGQIRSDEVQQRKRRASHVSWELHYGPIPSETYVLHRCDNPPCVRPDHLFLGTHADNMVDRSAKGRAARGSRSGAHQHPEMVPRGESHGMSKLTESAVQHIRQTRPSRAMVLSLARQYKVDVSTIWLVFHGKTWRHLPNR